MGIKDLERLYPIYQYANQLSVDFGLGFTFKFDSGSFETRIDINEDGNTWKGSGQLPLIGYRIFCPDILDYTNKIIIEFEEEAKPNKGAKRRKGHFEGNNRDVVRDWYYTIAKFDVLKIWESDRNWKETLKQFLLLVHTKKQSNDAKIKA